ncbi:phosphonate ABC transporter ATP-binding protein [Engelhardtia mirabilis]|uniref:Glutamine transport ATP-binding protein GlnQ n=1 Tax=Engelhardtia mirabilis TaxID=2528011 RepID=A0A518BNN8_9BACT|nr:Glutamine transport ATP-binding protein GlnQ [Planctomycetes bacterium Pla133]QDV02902.1 Glutamine transport ATP-binding protein GlnQ [Planctomycetes bacterium Pla86]
MNLGTRFELAGVGLELGGNPVLEGLDLVVEPGECVALVGPSGAGKTSLLQILSTGHAPTRGRVTIDGIDPATASAEVLRELRSNVGSVHQHHALVPELRALQNVLVGRFGRQGTLAGLRSLYLPRRRELREVHAVLDRVGIGELLYRPTTQLSGGERQRVAIARALYQAPRALLADEPVASVDPARARDTIALLVELARERGMTLLVSLHDLRLALDHFPRLIGLRNGRVEFDLATDEVGPSRFDDLYRLPRTAGGT